MKPSRYTYPLTRKGICTSKYYCTSLAPHAFGDDENCLNISELSVRDGKGVRPQISTSDEAHDASTYLIEDGRWQMFVSGNINKENKDKN